MTRFPLSLLALLGLAVRAPAQDLTDAEHRLTVLSGLAFAAERDALASPARYSGVAPFLQVGYLAADHDHGIAVRLGFSDGTLTSPNTDPSTDLPHQESLRGWLEAEYVHRVGRGEGSLRWSVGGILAVHATLVDHFYATGSDFGYGLFSASLGPAVSVAHPVGERSSLSARLAVPVLALVGRPYGDFRLVTAGSFPFRLVTVNVFQGVDLSAVFATPISPGLDFAFGYHLVLERFEDSDPVRYAAQSFSLELAVRLGAGS